MRLLRLLPGQYGTAVRCQITEYDMTRIPPYEAFSHVWKDPESPQQIQMSKDGR